jgi:hypothetical protein
MNTVVQKTMPLHLIGLVYKRIQKVHWLSHRMHFSDHVGELTVYFHFGYTPVCCRISSAGTTIESFLVAGSTPRNVPIKHYYYLLCIIYDLPMFGCRNRRHLRIIVVGMNRTGRLFFVIPDEPLW